MPDVPLYHSEMRGPGKKFETRLKNLQKLKTFPRFSVWMQKCLEACSRSRFIVLLMGFPIFLFGFRPLHTGCFKIAKKFIAKFNC